MILWRSIKWAMCAAMLCYAPSVTAFQSDDEDWDVFYAPRFCSAADLAKAGPVEAIRAKLEALAPPGNDESFSHVSMLKCYTNTVGFDFAYHTPLDVPGAQHQWYLHHSLKHWWKRDKVADDNSYFGYWSLAVDIPGRLSPTLVNILDNEGSEFANRIEKGRDQIAWRPVGIERQYFINKALVFDGVITRALEKRILPRLDIKSKIIVSQESFWPGSDRHILEKLAGSASMIEKIDIVTGTVPGSLCATFKIDTPLDIDRSFFGYADAFDTKEDLKVYFKEICFRLGAASMDLGAIYSFGPRDRANSMFILRAEEDQD